MEGGCIFLRVETKIRFQKVRGPFFFFFLMWTILTVFIEFVTVLCLFYVLAFPPQRHVGSQLPDQGSNLPRPALEGEVPITGPSEKSRDDSSSVSL